MGEGWAEALRASLASATSLLALLLLEGRDAAADPIIKVGAAVPFYYVLGSTPDAGIEDSNPGDATDSYKYEPLTMGAAATTDGHIDPTPYFVIAQGSLEKLAASGVGYGNPLNSRGTGGSAGVDGAGNSVFVGTSGNFVLLNGPTSLRTGASASYGYTIPSPAKGAARANALTDGGDNSTDDGLPVTPGIGRTAAAPASVVASGPDPGASTDRAAATPSYDYTQFSPRIPVSAPGFGDGASGVARPSQPAANTPRSTGEGRVFSGIIPGASVFNTLEPVARGSVVPASARRASSAMHNEAVKAFYTLLQQTARDVNPSQAAPANRPVDGYTPAGTDPLSFSILSLSGSAMIRQASVPLPIKVVGSGGGELPSSLTIFIGESKASDEAADALSYFFDQGVVR